MAGTGGVIFDKLGEIIEEIFGWRDWYDMGRKKKVHNVWSVGLRIPAPVRVWLLDQFKRAGVTQSTVISTLLLESVEHLPELLGRLQNDDISGLLLESRALQYVSREKRAPVALRRAREQERALERAPGPTQPESSSESKYGALRPQTERPRTEAATLLHAQDESAPGPTPESSRSRSKAAKPGRSRRTRPKLRLVEGGSELSDKRAGQGELLQTLTAIKFPGDFLVADIQSAFRKYRQMSDQSAKLREVPELADAIRVRAEILRAWGEQRRTLEFDVEELTKKAKTAKGRMKRLVDSRLRVAERELEEFDRVRRLDDRPLLKLFFRASGR